ncbi:MAG TPA: hypothetical protein VK906_00055 [Egicoccus sp.]|nr:hypothetical protein [Egicoccus sp.]HSK21531.1 hypothetical protein [Egicoccus sp.]
MRAATATAQHVGVALDRRLGGEPAQLPWGLAPRRDDAPPDQAYANLALARYAESLRRRRGAEPEPELRGLPLLARRDGGTATGANAGPGGLARSFVPVEHQVRPEVARAVKGEKPRTVTPAPAPLAVPPAAPSAARRRGGR